MVARPIDCDHLPQLGGLSGDAPLVVAPAALLVTAQDHRPSDHGHGLAAGVARSRP